MKRLINKSSWLILSIAFCFSSLSGSLLASSDLSLIGYWRLDEGKDEVAYDRSGLGNNGVIKGATWAINEEGACLECGGMFSGENYYVEIGSKPIFDLTEELTISAWIKPTTDAVGGTFVSKGTTIQTYDYATGYTFFTGNSVAFGKIGFMIKPESASRWGGWYRVESDTEVLKRNVWSYVAVTYSVKDNKTIFYHNGERIKEAPAAGKIVHPNPCALTIGVDSLYRYNPMNGFIREVKLYSRALSSDEIKASYQKNLYITKLNPEFKEEKANRILREKCTANISASIIDSTTGKKMNARVYVKGSDGRNYFPDDKFFSYYLNMEDQQGYFYAIGGDFTVRVPPSEKIELTVSSGFEYEIKQLNIELNNAEKRELRIELKRLIDMFALGWYNGEHHIHYRIGGPSYGKDMKFDDACEVCKGEGINFANFMDGSTADVPNYENSPTHKNTERFIAHCDVEPGSVIAGHICLMGMTGPPHGYKEPDYKSPENCAPIDNTWMIDDTAGRGGVAIYTHPGAYIEDVDNPNTGTPARELPLHVALGKAPIWDVLCWDNGGAQHEIKLTYWYRYLNLGFKLAGSGSTDCNLNMPSVKGHFAPGAMRTYVKIDKLSWPKVIEAYIHGRTFVTNGPLLLFSINGKDIGDTVYISNGKEEELRFHVEAFSLYGIEKVALIKNGQTIKTLLPVSSQSTPLAIGEQVKEDFQLKVNKTCWFAVRVYGKERELFGQFAHSSPIYVQFGDDPIEPKQEDIDYFLNWLDKYRKVIPEWCKLNKLADNQEQNQRNEWVYKLIDAANGIYNSLTTSPRNFK